MEKPRIGLLLAALLLILPLPAIATAPGEHWSVALDSRYYGPLQGYWQVVRESDGSLLIEVGNGAPPVDLQADPDGASHGTLPPSLGSAGLIVRATADGFAGEIADGPLAGRFTAVATPPLSTALRDYPELAGRMDRTFRDNVYAKEALEHPDYVLFRDGLLDAAKSVTDDLGFVAAFARHWQGRPFSHVRLQRSTRPLDAMIDYLDKLRIGQPTATLRFENDIAVLNVQTMMGVDTIEQIEAAYDDIADRRPAALIVDLRSNTGGAFAVKPLVEHLLDEPLDAGYFVSRNGLDRHNGLPTAAEALAVPAWEGWSIRAFWESLLSSGVIRVRFAPAEPAFAGPVVVLTSNQSASATELAADALQANGRAVLIGETTAGEMLSQTLFDLGDGYQLSLPIADYFSFTSGRIEGRGLKPDIPTTADKALEAAVEHLQQSTTH